MFNNEIILDFDMMYKVFVFQRRYIESMIENTQFDDLHDVYTFENLLHMYRLHSAIAFMFEIEELINVSNDMDDIQEVFEFATQYFKKYQNQNK